MAMPPRPLRRRGGSQRWLIIPFVLTMLVLLVDASMHARSSGPETTINSQAWVDTVLPYIAESTVQGREIAQISSDRLTDGSAAAAGQLSRIAAAAASTYKGVTSLSPPAPLAAAAGLLDACLVSRDNGAAEMAAAVQDLLRGGRATDAVGQMNAAVSQFQVGDTAYQLFARDMPKLGVSMPASQWDDGVGLYQMRALGGFAERLVAAVTRSPLHKLAIDAISTNPPALSMAGKVQVLSPASSVSVTVVVQDVGQDPERGIRVVASVGPGQGLAGQQLSASVNLSRGQAQAVSLAGLRLAPSTPTVVTVQALEPADEAGSVSKALLIELPGPGFTAPATTTPPATAAPSSTTTTTASAAPTTGAAATTAAVLETTTAVPTTAPATTTVAAPTTTLAPTTSRPTTTTSRPTTTTSRPTTTRPPTTLAPTTVTTIPPAATTTAPAATTTSPAATTTAPAAATTVSPATTTAAAVITVPRTT
jgi:hypothetical protein